MSHTAPLYPTVLEWILVVKEAILLYLVISVTASLVSWSEFLATDPEARVRFPALPEEKVVGLERGPPSLVSTTEELLDRKVAAPV
jgi:hypothetical protein